MGSDHTHANFDATINESKSPDSLLYTLLIDAKGAFDNISHASLLKNLDCSKTVLRLFVRTKDCSGKDE